MHAKQKTVLKLFCSVTFHVFLSPETIPILSNPERFTWKICDFSQKDRQTGNEGMKDRFAESPSVSVILKTYQLLENRELRAICLKSHKINHV